MQMAQVFVRTHNVGSLRKFMEPELRNLRKKTLSLISDAIGAHFPSNCKKDKQIDSILTKIIDLFNTGRRNGQSQEITVESIMSKFITIEESQAVMLRKTLVAYCDSFKNSPPAIFSTQIRKPTGVFVEDVQKTQACICNSESYTGAVVRCTICLQEFHKDCFKIPPNELFECPFCFIKNMDPLHEVVGTVFMGYLRLMDTIHNLRFAIHEHDLPNPKFQVEIRCVRLDGKNNYEMTWPDCGYIKLNENKILDMKPLVNNSSLRRRKDEAKLVDRKIMRVDLDNFIQVTVMPPQMKDQVRVSAANHLLGIFIVRIDTAHQLFDRVRNKIISKEDSRDLLIGGYMNSVEELEIDRLSISMKCVFSMMPIKIPARSRECTHFNCFDLEHMIITNTKTQPRRWRCPICKKKAHSLVIDPILLDIIRSSEPKILSDVTFFKDGSFKINQEKEEPEDDYDSETERQPKITGPLICLDDDEQVQRDKVSEAVSLQENVLRENPLAVPCFNFEPNPFAIEELPPSIHKEMEIQRNVVEAARNQRVQQFQKQSIQKQSIQKQPIQKNTDQSTLIVIRESIELLEPESQSQPQNQPQPQPQLVEPLDEGEVLRRIVASIPESITETIIVERRAQLLPVEASIDIPPEPPKLKDITSSMETTDTTRGTPVPKKRLQRLPPPFEIITPTSPRDMSPRPSSDPMRVGDPYSRMKPPMPMMKPVYPPPPSYPYLPPFSSLYGHMMPPYGSPYDNMYLREYGPQSMPPMNVPPPSAGYPINPAVLALARQQSTNSQRSADPKKSQQKPPTKNTSEVIEIVDSDDETELQKIRRKEREQMNKLNQSAAKSLEFEHQICDAERLTFFKIVEMWRKNSSQLLAS